MLESLMKPSPKTYNSPRSPTKKTAHKIPQLADLETEIISKRPNNVTQFIRDWATSRLGKFTLAKNQYDDSDDEEEVQFSLKKGFRAERRFALCIDNSLFNQSLEKLPRKEKLQETKSMILIKLKSMNILKGLSNELLWDLVEDFEQKQYQHDECIISRKEPVRNFYIIISGSVTTKVANKKQQSLSDGDHFGEDSLVFGTPSPLEYSSQGITRIAHLEGRRISNILRNTNMEKYKIICRSLQKIEQFKVLHEDEIDKVAEIAINQAPVYTQLNQQIDMESFPSSMFIVIKGLFYSYSKKLNHELRKDHNREYKVGDAFGTDCLKRVQITDSIVSQDYGAILQVKCSDVERVIGPLPKLEKRRRKRH